MKKIVIFGAGRSSTSLIKYLLDHSKNENWTIIVLDRDLKMAQKKVEVIPMLLVLLLMLMINQKD